MLHTFKKNPSMATPVRVVVCSLVLAMAGLAGLFLSPAAGAAEVGVSIGISQPGVYGRIDIGRFPQPTLVAPKPVVIRPARVAVQPVYLWVPPGHQKHWGKHCHRYNACNTPVYFVREDWYHAHVAPPPHGRGRGHGHD